MCVTMLNFVPIGQTFAEIWLIFDFPNGGSPSSGIYLSWKFYLSTTSESQCASSCRLSRRSANSSRDMANFDFSTWRPSAMLDF